MITLLFIVPLLTGLYFGYVLGHAAGLRHSIRFSENALDEVLSKHHRDFEEPKVKPANN